VDVSSWNDATFEKREATMVYHNRVKMINQLNSNDENSARTRMSRMPCFFSKWPDLFLETSR